MKLHLLQLVLLASVAALVSSEELISTTTLVPSSSSSTPEDASPLVTPKLRNVDDPNKDPAEYSRQWITILEQLESGMNQWQFGARFQSAIQSAAGSEQSTNLNISQKCLDALGLYFERPMEQEWTFKSKCIDYLH